jgi:hypothetical protein
MRILVWMSVGLFAAALSGCGGSDGGGSSGNGGEGGTGQGGMGPGSTGQGGTGQGGSGQGGGSVCGGFPGTPCGTGEYCDYPDDSCGAADGTGICLPMPQGCPGVYSPVCGCDGMVHGNDCEAAGAGTDVSNAGGCTDPTGTFACGPTFCAKNQQYCMKTLSDVPGLPDSYLCGSLPTECFQGTPPSCPCIDGVCGAPMQNCSESPAGDLTVVCPGG